MNKYQIGGKLLNLLEHAEEGSKNPQLLIARATILQGLASLEIASAIRELKDILGPTNEPKPGQPTKKLKKIVGVSNYDDEAVGDILIADNVNPAYAKRITEHLQNTTREGDTYYPELKDEDYKLYEFKP